MKTRLLLGSLASLLTLPALAGDLSGTWLGSLTSPHGDKHTFKLELQVEGETVTGTMTGGPPVAGPQKLSNGKLVGDELSFDIVATKPFPGTYVWKATVKDDRLEGTHTLPIPPRLPPGAEAKPAPTLKWEATKK
jgi:hypothetical protein